MNIPLLKLKLAASFQETIDWLQIQDEAKFEQGPEGKWDTSQHLDHLMGTAIRVESALKLPKSMIRENFGKPDWESRDYDSIVADYREKLKSIPDTVVPVGNKHPVTKKNTLLSQFEEKGKAVGNAIDLWTEEELNDLILPHPLIGNMTVRELLLWMAYHNHHHLNNLKENY